VNHSEVEIRRFKFYEVPLVRHRCPRCGESTGWSGDFAALIYFELMHECKESK
jgi:hypothetical protein